jgi:hypothetical protein
VLPQQPPTMEQVEVALGEVSRGAKALWRGVDATAAAPRRSRGMRGAARTG